MRKTLFSAFVLVISVLTTSSVYALAPWTGNSALLENRTNKSAQFGSFIKEMETLEKEMDESGKYEASPYVQAQPYIQPNEPELSEFIEKLEQQPVDHASTNCHIGVSGLFNYDIIAARNSDFGLLVDINRNTVLIHWLVLHLLKQKNTNSRQDFVSKFQENLYHHSRDLMIFGNKRIIDVKLELTRAGSWLSTDEKFEQIRQMAVENRLLPMQISLTESNGLQKIAQALQDNGLRVDTLYTSNVIEWLLKAKKSGFDIRASYATSMLPLIDKASLYISSDQVGTGQLKLDINSPKNNTYPFFEFLSVLQQSA